MVEVPEETLPRDETVDGAGPGRGTAAELLLLLECDRPLASSASYSLHHVGQVEIGRGGARAARFEPWGHQERLRISLPDRRISAAHAQVLYEGGTWLAIDRASRNGLLHNGAPVERVALSDGDVLEIGHSFFLFRQAAPPRHDGARIVDLELAPAVDPVLNTLNLSLAAQLRALSKLAPSTLPILIHGESGSGKELFARALHGLSRRTGPFVALNCGALPPAAFESQLFGHCQGAGADATEGRPGLLRSGQGGTLFLDEVGDLPPAAQAALRRALLDRELTPVGADRALPLDLRVIASTQRDPRRLRESGLFREDLLTWLTANTLRLPALRERREDTGILLACLLRKLAPARDSALHVSPGVIRALLAHDWPGNVRELEQSLGMALLLSGNDDLRSEHLPEALRRLKLRAPAMPEGADPSQADDQLRRDELVRLLARYQHNVSAVARHMGKGRTQIQRWMKRYGL
jgi:transcriptional regulator with PAS, ATPase and Fis domain